MYKKVYIIAFLLITGTAFAQVKVDSSFAFSTNPAKEYSLYIPSNYNGSIPNKMMVAFHPFNISRWNSESWRDTLTAFAESNDLLLVCPDGGPNGDISDPIDYGFTEALIDSVMLWYNIDTTSIYAMGFSVGGLATYEYGLNHTSVFGGYIPIGAAVTLSSAFMSNIGNSSCEPFYLVHGSNDSPNTRFYPLIDSLENNCAIVNSNLMSGVMHTIDFPNRNQILSDAFFWIDSVNHAPSAMNYPISPIAPPNLSAIVVQGFSNKELNVIWESSDFAPGCTEYTLLADSLTGNFSAPLFSFVSGNNGTDTNYTFTYAELDTLLTLNGLMNGNAFPLKWAVAVKYYCRFVDTTKSFELTLTKQRVGFSLLSPASNAYITLQEGNSRLFDWSNMRGNDITYDLLFDTVGGDFSNPIGRIPSSNNGVNSLLSLSHSELYYDVILPNFQAAEGDTIELIWTAQATDSTYTENALKDRKINFVIGDVPFELISPPNNTISVSRNNVVLSFFWDTIQSVNYTFEWTIDTANTGFNNPLTTFSSSDNGKARRLPVGIDIMDSVMNVFEIPYGDTLRAWWNVRATDGTNGYLAPEAFAIKVFRDFPEGIIKNTGNGQIQIYPNPVHDKLYISGFDELSEVSIITVEGKAIQVSFTYSGNKGVVDLSGISKGMYLLRITNRNGQSTTQRVIVD